MCLENILILFFLKCCVRDFGYSYCDCSVSSEANGSKAHWNLLDNSTTSQEESPWIQVGLHTAVIDRHDNNPCWSNILMVKHVPNCQMSSGIVRIIKNNCEIKCSVSFLICTFYWCNRTSSIPGPSSISKCNHCNRKCTFTLYKLCFTLMCNELFIQDH